MPSPASGRAGTLAKLPLPPLPRPRDHRTPIGERTRISHACEPCRRRKAKCDGAQPVCKRCGMQGLACDYADSNKQKAKRTNQTLATRVQIYEVFLRQLLPTQNEATKAAIQNVLSEAGCLRPERTQSKGISEVDAPPQGEWKRSDEYSAGADAGSPKMQDRIRHDAPGFARSTGFLGKASTVRLVEEITEKILPGSRAEEPEEINRILLEATSYHVNDLDISEFGEVGELVDPFHLPSKSTADFFVRAYFNTVHPFFPIVLRSAFQKEYALFWGDVQSTTWDFNLWLANLNLIFALGALHSHYVNPEWADNDRDHVLYFVRARLLSPEPLTMTDLPTIEKVQVSALSGMYLVAKNQFNRAWHTVGTAIRYAQSNGLHLINDSPGMTETQRELEVRVWHALCSLEILVGFLTGRTTSIQDRHNSTRLPRVMEGESSYMLSTFQAGVILDRITSEVLFDVYSANTVLLSWSEIQATLAHFNSKLANWRAQLPQRLSMETQGASIEKAPINERMYLALRYFSTSMLINRPSLCDIEVKNAAMPLQSLSSQDADFHSATRCVVSARNLVKLFPNRPHVEQLCGATPWWSVLHYLVQAGAVLILEIWFKVAHAPDSGDSIIEDVGKVLMWLQAMARTSHPAFRAWTALSRLLELAASGIGKDARHVDSVSLFLPDFASLPSMTQEKPSQNTHQPFGSRTPMEGPSPSYQSPQSVMQQQHQPTQQYSALDFATGHGSLPLSERLTPPQAPFHMHTLPPYGFWNPSESYVPQVSTSFVHDVNSMEPQPMDVSEFFPDANEIAKMIEEHLRSRDEDMVMF